MQTATSNYGYAQITDSSNVAISGAENAHIGTSTALSNFVVPIQLFGYATPGTTSATTYKGRFLSNAGGIIKIKNTDITGQLYAIEVSA